MARMRPVSHQDQLTLVEHLLLLQGLKKFGLNAADVTLVNFPTNETPQALASGQVSADIYTGLSKR